MSEFWSVFRYEFLMSIRRKGLWLAYGLLFLFYIVSIVIDRGFVENVTLSTSELWTSSAQFAFMFNILLPVVGGISAADRLVRDRTLRVDELLSSTALTNRDYIAGKYLGVLTSLLLPVFIFQLVLRVYTLILGVPVILLGMTVVCFFVITVPAYAFVTAFSLACPLVLPVRVYQVLFTGYWFWGNFLSPSVFPTLSGTLLQPGGKVAMEGLFNATFGGESAYGTMDVLLNFAILAICIVAVLMAANLFLTRRSRLA